MDEAKNTNLDSNVAANGRDHTETLAPAIEESAAGVAPAMAETTAPSRKKRSGLLALAIIIAMIGLAAAAFWYQKNHSPATTIGSKEYPSVVALVNGAEVTNKQFVQSYQQAAGIATQQGFDANDATVQKQIEDQALTVLINTVLIVQAAEKAGFTASTEEIDAEVDKLEQQFGGSEQLASVLSGAGLSETAVRDDLNDQIIVDKYLNDSPEWKAISVTAEEKKAFYDQVAGLSTSTPPYAEVEPMVEEQLLNQKQQAATETIIARLMASSTIEKLI